MRLVRALTTTATASRGCRGVEPFRWVIWLVLVVAIGTAVFDGIFGSWGNLIVSVIYLVMLVGEVLWWPKRREQLLSNADRAAELSNPLSRPPPDVAPEPVAVPVPSTSNAQNESRALSRFRSHPPCSNALEPVSLSTPRHGLS